MPASPSAVWRRSRRGNAVELIARLAIWSMFGFGVVLFAVQYAAREVGYYFGRRHAARVSGDSDGIGTMVGAMLGLLAFVLALTLNFADGRFSERRTGALAEANAIGTSWLRAKAIAHPRAALIAHELEDYAAIRAAFVRAPADEAVIEDINRRTAAMQTLIWGHMSAIVRDRADPVVTSLMSSLNETFDAATSVRFAYDFHMPGELFWLLIGMATVGMAALGFLLGLKERPLRMLAACLTAMWTVVIVDIVDLSAARIGALRNSGSVYDWTIGGFAGGVPIPPLPAPAPAPAQQ
jgi:hypothetical protein